MATTGLIEKCAEPAAQMDTLPVDGLPMLIEDGATEQRTSEPQAGLSSSSSKSAVTATTLEVPSSGTVFEGSQTTDKRPFMTPSVEKYESHSYYLRFLEMNSLQGSPLVLLEHIRPYDERSAFMWLYRHIKNRKYRPRLERQVSVPSNTIRFWIPMKELQDIMAVLKLLWAHVALEGITPPSRMGPRFDCRTTTSLAFDAVWTSEAPIEMVLGQPALPFKGAHCRVESYTPADLVLMRAEVMACELPTPEAALIGLQHVLNKTERGSIVAAFANELVEEDDSYIGSLTLLYHLPGSEGLSLGE